PGRIDDPPAAVGQAFQPAEIAKTRSQREADKDVRPTGAENSPTDTAERGTSEHPPESPSKPAESWDGLPIRPTARGDPEG
ncbi:MAG: hypothetical protein WD066_05495, partial [Planctomycetaceae bacterium]